MYSLPKIIFLVFITTFLNCAYSLTVKDFHPQGEVKLVRQVVVTISEQMITLGDLRDQLKPFEINCSVKGNGRWQDTKTWIYDLVEDLPGGKKCTFKVRNKITSLEGNKYQGKKSFTFNTGAVTIFRTDPEDGSQSIEEDQAFCLLLDGSLDDSEVVKRGYFKIQNLEDRIPIRLIKGRERKEVLKRTYLTYAEKKKSIVIIQAKRRFPSNHRIFLIWGKGNKREVYKYKTRHPLKATVTCERKNPKSPCSPLTDIELVFTNPIDKENFRKIEVRDQLYIPPRRTEGSHGPRRPHGCMVPRQRGKTRRDFTSHCGASSSTVILNPAEPYPTVEVT